jgi:hypothetical protein
MAPFKIPATAETQHLLEAQREREQRRQQDTDGASQASTADIDDEDGTGDDTNDTNEDNGCIAFDTIETYTANVQNKKRIFADETLRV